jgi:hypothetical protein
MKKCSCLEVEQLSQNENITINKIEFYEILLNDFFMEEGPLVQA